MTDPFCIPEENFVEIGLTGAEILRFLMTGFSIVKCKTSLVMCGITLSKLEIILI